VWERAGPVDARGKTFGSFTRAGTWNIVLGNVYVLYRPTEQEKQRVSFEPRRSGFVKYHVLLLLLLLLDWEATSFSMASTSTAAPSQLIARSRSRRASRALAKRQSKGTQGGNAPTRPTAGNEASSSSQKPRQRPSSGQTANPSTRWQFNHQATAPITHVELAHARLSKAPSSAKQTQQTRHAAADVTRLHPADPALTRPDDHVPTSTSGAPTTVENNIDNAAADFIQTQSSPQHEKKMNQIQRQLRETQRHLDDLDAKRALLLQKQEQLHGTFVRLKKVARAPAPSEKSHRLRDKIRLVLAADRFFAREKRGLALRDVTTPSHTSTEKALEKAPTFSPTTPPPRTNINAKNKKAKRETIGFRGGHRKRGGLRTRDSAEQPPGKVGRALIHDAVPRTQSGERTNGNKRHLPAISSREVSKSSLGTTVAQSFREFKKELASDIKNFSTECCCGRVRINTDTCAKLTMVVGLAMSIFLGVLAVATILLFAGKYTVDNQVAASLRLAGRKAGIHFERRLGSDKNYLRLNLLADAIGRGMPKHDPIHNNTHTLQHSDLMWLEARDMFQCSRAYYASDASGELHGAALAHNTSNRDGLGAMRILERAQQGGGGGGMEYRSFPVAIKEEVGCESFRVVSTLGITVFFFPTLSSSPPTIPPPPPFSPQLPT
jgi:hypothetical protein